ncbi:MAG: single-stranded-DNA-specific exonuclease RecJ [Bacillota bacterium]
MDIKINILNEDMEIPGDVVKACGGDELLARIFYNRGYKNPDTIFQMLNDDSYNSIKTEEFPGMKKAVDRVLEAIEKNEKICIYGDYDVDGVTSTVTLVECLGFFTRQVTYHVPDRFTEGYGMNEEVVKNIGAQGVSLIITCDCGISNINEISTAKKLGMDVILTDHHNVPKELPAADVILNPKLLEEGHKARNISGCAMAYFLCMALLERKGMEDRAPKFLDLLALSLIADVVSLNAENRYLLKKAMPVLLNTQRTGLKELFEVVQKDCKLTTEEDIAFQIAPRINAAGRMESARLPVELLLCDDPVKVGQMARKIDLLNMERKRVQQQIIDEAVEMVETRKKNKTVLVLFSEFWHHGIIGIAAGRICQQYGKPAILLSLKEDSKTVVGSARSIEEIDIYELIKECSSKLLKFGGHSQAAGLSLKKDDLEDFIKEIEIAAEKKHFIRDTINVDVDMELGLEKVDEGLYERLLRAGPYGEGFELPKFYAGSVTVVSDRKTSKNHHIMVLEDNNNVRIPAVKWFGPDESLDGRVFDITYKVSRNTYRGSSDIQLTLEYLSENRGMAKRLFNGGIIDERGTSTSSVLVKYADALYFYEGLKSACPVEYTVDRFNVSKCSNLVFLSPPANTGILREVIALANPDNIIISFSILPDYTFKGFVTNLLGLIKYAVKEEYGGVYVEQLSLKLCVEESIIKAGLKFLQAKGMIQYVLSEDDSKVYISKGHGSLDKNIFTKEKSLRNALMEKNAYQQFMLKMEADKFREYLK